MFESNASPQTDEISECNYGISLNLERGRQNVTMEFH